MKSHKGQTIVEWLVVIGIVAIIIGVFGTIGFGYWNRHIHGNKQFFDFRQNFRYAYVTEGTNVVRYGVKKWNDWKYSDAVQIITDDDRCIYTHLNRVILSNR